MTEALWMDEYDRICDEYVASKIDRDEAEKRFRRLGFEPDEIADHMAIADEHRIRIVK